MDFFYKEKYLKYKKKYLNLKNLEGGNKERKRKRKQFFLGLKKEENYEKLPGLLKEYLNSEYFINLTSDKAIKIDIDEYKNVPDSVTKIMLDNIEKLNKELELELPAKNYLEILYSKLLKIYQKNNIEKIVNYFCPSNNAKICKENIKKYINTSFDSENFVENLNQDELEKLLVIFKVVFNKSTEEIENPLQYMLRLHSYALENNDTKFNIDNWKFINEFPPIKNFIGLLISKYNDNQTNQPEITKSYDKSEVTKSQTSYPELKTWLKNNS